jgi:hypothetical protein
MDMFNQVAGMALFGFLILLGIAAVLFYTADIKMISQETIQTGMFQPKENVISQSAQP